MIDHATHVAGTVGGSGACGTEYHTTAPPACAKNHITVGALNSDDDTMTSFSSWGPTDDGRIKPDISGPGCQSNDDGGVTSCDYTGDSAYTVMCGRHTGKPVPPGPRNAPRQMDLFAYDSS